MEDVSTNMYIDDHATRAAPYTLASQFNLSMVSSDGDESDDEHSGGLGGGLPRPLSLTSLNPSPYSEKRRGSLLKQMADASEKITEKLANRDFGARKRELMADFNREQVSDWYNRIKS